MISLAHRRRLAPPAPGRRPAVRAFLAGLVLAWVVAGPVLAHADLVTADPADGAVLTEAPVTITLTFSEALNAVRSSVTLIAASGTVGTGSATVDGTVMTLGPLVQDGRPLGPGRYEIRWTSVAADGDVLRGKLTFTVSEPTPAPETPAPTPIPASTPVDTPSPPESVAPTSSETIAPEPSPSAAPTAPAASTGDVVLPIVVALLAIVAIGALVLRRKGGA